ncbi:MAG: hypothetical protein ACI89U_002014, partial [Gammaproteobacteria bacterium]
RNHCVTKNITINSTPFLNSPFKFGSGDRIKRSE